MKLSEQEGLRVVQMMLAMRPDWTRNKPGRMLREVNEAGGLPLAEDFGHVVRALAAYATETGPDGRHAKRTPNLFPADGRHWSSTATVPAPLPRGPACEDHREEQAANCRCCQADVKVGQRPATHIGKHYQPESETTA